MARIDIQPLTPDRLPDLGALFGQGGDPKWCWCAWYRLRSLDFRSASAASNRSVLEATMLEAYPVDTTAGRVSAATAFKGTLSMFERAGFEVVARRRANRTSPERPIVRRALG